MRRGSDAATSRSGMTLFSVRQDGVAWKLDYEFADGIVQTSSSDAYVNRGAMSPPEVQDTREHFMVLRVHYWPIALFRCCAATVLEAKRTSAPVRHATSLSVRGPIK